MTEPQPALTPDAARAELDQVTAWLTRYQEMTAQAPQVQQRGNYLTGYLEAVKQVTEAGTAPSNGEGVVVHPTQPAAVGIDPTVT